MVKILYITIMMSSASGGFVTQIPTGDSPLDPTRGLPSPDPKLCSPRIRFLAASLHQDYEVSFQRAGNLAATTIAAAAGGGDGVNVVMGTIVRVVWCQQLNCTGPADWTSRVALSLRPLPIPCSAGFKRGPGGRGPKLSNNRGHPTKSFIFYFSLTTDTYERTT